MTTNGREDRSGDTIFEEITEAGGHFVVDHVICLELFRLLSAVLADREIKARSENGIFEKLNGLAIVARTEVGRLLVSTAIMIRTRLDKISFKRPNEPPCGTLQYEGKREVELTIREACNKIIHAKEVLLAHSGAQTDSASYLLPKVELRGRHQDVAWRCIVDLVDYVRAGLSLPPEIHAPISVRNRKR